ncbi:MAG: hypothetical protein GY938_18095, partial [Ketobacter sp.]|nr:hypothetical protein [Ketobacter sp.]
MVVGGSGAHVDVRQSGIRATDGVVQQPVVLLLGAFGSQDAEAAPLRQPGHRVVSHQGIAHRALKVEAGRTDADVHGIAGDLGPAHRGVGPERRHHDP